MRLPGNSTGMVLKVLKTVERHLRILPDFDEVAIGITHVGAPFPAVIVQRLGKEGRLGSGAPPDGLGFFPGDLLDTLPFRGYI
ncbi:MAG: hypothetical protein WBE13_15545 [Candidatus Acidiferrum sp.]